MKKKEKKLVIIKWKKKVNYINAHATSTLSGDLAEINALKQVFKNTSEIKINATKSMIGHCLTAAGGLEAIATVKAIVTGWLHPSINQFNPEPAIEFDTVANKKQLHEVNVDWRVGAVLMGTGMGGLTVFSDGVWALIEKGYRKITPLFIPYALKKMGSVLLAMDDFMAANYSISTACATLNFYFYATANHVQWGEVDIILASGTDAVAIPIGLGGFVACRALSQRNDDRKTASRSWDKEQDGFVMGKGAGVLDGVLKYRGTYEILSPEDIGQSVTNESSIVLGKNSGRYALRSRLIELGYNLNGDELDNLFRQFKEVVETKKHISNDDLEALVGNKIPTGSHPN